MAKQTSLITFTGKVGNLIGYRRNNQLFLRSMPETVRQTTATRRAAQRFGVASKKGRLIRSAFSNELDIRCDGGHVNRLNKALILAGRNNTGAIAGFRFNQHTDIDRFFTVAPTLSRDGILHIPAQALPQFKGITALEVKVIAARINFAERRVISTETAMVILDTRESFAGAALSVDVPGKGTLMVTLQVRSLLDGRPSGNRKYVAAGIIAVMEPQTQQIFQKQAYTPQTIIPRQMKILRSPAQAHPVVQRE